MLAAIAHAGRPAVATLAQRGHALRCIVELTDGGSRGGPLSELTYLAKDLLDVAGRPPTCGLASAADTPPRRDAAILTMLDAAGARRLGFAEMTALAFEPSGSNPGRQRPLNPWSRHRVCGGSSSGSAVAVAAGLCDIAIGSDTAGSLRIPAQCCGVTAWKPTHGVMPVAGAMPLAPSLDVLGLLARSAQLLLRAARVLLPEATLGKVSRIALAQDLIDDAEPDIGDAVTDFRDILSRSGLKLAPEPLKPLLAACDMLVLDVLQGECALQHGWRLAGGTLDPTLANRLRKGLAIPVERLDEARSRLKAIAGALTIFRHHDAILLPAMPIPTPEIAACEPGSPSFSPRTLYGLSAYTRFVNGLGLPAVALPCGFDRNGMPVAAQLVGPPGSDLALLDCAAKIQRLGDWHMREPAGLAAILEAA